MGTDAEGHAAAAGEGAEGGAGGGDGRAVGGRLTEAIDNAARNALAAWEVGAQLPERDRLLSAFSACVVTLHDRGALREPPAPEAPSTEMEPEEAARELARLSRHVRYDGDDGWPQLLEYPHNVDHAYTCAIAAGWSPGEVAIAQRARTILLRHHRALTTTDGGG